jgi:glycosyltransferase involved in cell wall biosynthesis
MISTIIPTYKSPEALEICLKSAIENQKFSNQIIVVVDGFYNINKEVLEKYKDAIDILNLEENVGLSKATNIGVYNSKFDRILVVNDDNVFPTDWDDKLLSNYKEDRVISPNQIEPNESIFDEFVIKSFGPPEDFNLKDFNEYEKQLSSDTITGKGSTLPFFMNKQYYLVLGGWDEGYPGAWTVDWDFFHKCDLAGLEMIRTFNCHFYHFVSVGTESSAEEKMKKSVLEKECHEYFNYKWGFKPAKRIENYKLCSIS